MSAEAFTTIASCDVRTAPDGVNVEAAPSGSQQPRLADRLGGERSNCWVSGYLYAEGALDLAAHAIETQPMDGLTGDHPEKRAQIAAIISACAFAVRELALDHACDGALDEKGSDWSYAIGYIRQLCDFPYVGIPAHIARILERTHRHIVVGEP